MKIDVIYDQTPNENVYNLWIGFAFAFVHYYEYNYFNIIEINPF